MITENKICKYCGKQINPYKRKDSLFCSPVCRKLYWENQNRRKEKKRYNIIIGIKIIKKKTPKGVGFFEV